MTLVSLVRARAVLCVRETWRVTTCGCAIVRACTAQDMVQCGVHQLSRVVSFLCTGRCGASRWRKKLTSIPKGVTPQPHAPHCVSSSRCARAEKVLTLLAFRGLASSGRVTPFSRVTRGPGHQHPQPQTLRLWGGRTPFTPRSKRESGHQTLDLGHRGWIWPQSENPDSRLHQAETRT